MWAKALLWSILLSALRDLYCSHDILSAFFEHHYQLDLFGLATLRIKVHVIKILDLLGVHIMFIRNNKVLRLALSLGIR